MTHSKLKSVEDDQGSGSDSGSISTNTNTNTRARVKHQFSNSKGLNKLEKGVSKFCKSLQECIGDMNMDGSMNDGTDSINTNSTNNINNSTNSINNNHNNGIKRINASDVVQASAFLQSQHDKLSRIESSLPSLVDLLLDLHNNDNGDDNGNGDGNDNGNYQQPKQRLKKKMTLTELSSQLRHLHSCHAKQILHIESTLVSQYGYITTSLQDKDSSSAHNCNSNSNSNSNSNNISLSDGDHGCDSPLALWKPKQELLNQLTPLHAPLSRLSEATFETDGGTPGGSTCLLGSSLGSSLGSVHSYNHHNHNHKVTGTGTGTGTGTPRRMSIDHGSSGSGAGVLMALVEDGEEEHAQECNEITAIDVDVDIDIDNGNGNDENINTNTGNNTSQVSDSFHHPLDTEDDHFNMEEIRQACQSHGDISEYSNQGFEDDSNCCDSKPNLNSCNEQGSCYDSRQEEMHAENSMGRYLDETLDDTDTDDNDDNDDETLVDSMEEDTAVSIASTVVRDVNRLKNDVLQLMKDEGGEAVVVAGSGKERGATTVTADLRCGNETDLGDSREETDIPSILMMQLDDDNHAEDDDNLSPIVNEVVGENNDSLRGFVNINDSNDCSITQIVGSASLHHVQLENLSNADIYNGDNVSATDTESEGTEVDSSKEVDESNLSKDTRYSTIDTSLYINDPSVQEMNETHVDTSLLILEMVETPQQRAHHLLLQSRGMDNGIIDDQQRQQHLDPHEEVVTSPLDRFQVQVYNGGTKCKVTPIGNDILRATQSPILRTQSPILPSSVSRRIVARTNSPRIQTHSSHASFQSPPVAQRRADTHKVYPKTPLPKHKEEQGPENQSTRSEETESFYSSNTSQEEEEHLSRNDSLDDSHLGHDDSMHSIQEIEAFMDTACSASASLPNLDDKTPETTEADITEVVAGNRVGVYGNSEGISTSPSQAQKEDRQKPFNTPSMHNSSTPLNSIKKTVSSTTSRANAALSGILSRTPRAAAFIEKHMAEEKDALLEVLNVSKPTNDLASDFASESRQSSASPAISVEANISRQDVLEDDPRLINPLTVEEYEASPPIIKKLVSRDDMNRGIVTINNWLISQEGEMPSSLPESTAVDIFGDSFNASQVKRIFLSLCSLQRMMINRKTSASGKSEMHYVILR